MSEEAVVQEAQQPVQEAAPEQQTPPQEQPQEEAKPPKTFTQEELDAQINKRLARERKKYEREREREYAELRQSLMQRAEAKPAEQPAGMPKIEDYQDFEAYLNARDAYLTQRLKGETIAEYEKRQQAERAQRERQKTLDTYQKRAAQAAKDMPDFDDVVYRPDVPISDVMAHTIMESEVGPKIAYYLATHTDEADEIAGMHPLAAVKALTRIEDKLSSEKAQVSNAPPPTTPVGTKAKASKEPHEMDAEEFAKWRKAYIAKR
jgi:hypothetical protein